MESSVRYVQLPNAGQKPALCFRGEKLALAVVNDRMGIHTLQISLKDHDKAGKVQRLGQDYMPRAFAEAMVEVARTKGITPLAAYLIDSLRYSRKLDEEKLPPEEELPVMTREDDDGDDSADDETFTIPEFSVKAKPKAKLVRKAPKRVNSQGKAEDPLGMSSTLRSIAESGKAKRTNGSAGPPRSADRPSKPAPILPLPRKTAGTAKEPSKAKASRGGAGKTLVSVLASELGIAQQPCRVKLRAAGLRAPYDEKSEAACRKALGLPPKGKK